MATEGESVPHMPIGPKEIIEPAAVGAAAEAPSGACLNCGTALAGAYCVICGQAAHVHRSFLSIGHDILHSAFHFEGKFWRTIPELVFHPGRLTRRYIDGERAKFISPMALFLFSVFLMYAVFAFVPSTEFVAERQLNQATSADLEAGALAVAEVTEDRIEDLRRRLDDAMLSADGRAEIEVEIDRLELSRAIMNAIAVGDWQRVEALRPDAGAAAGPDASARPDGTSEIADRSPGGQGPLEFLIKLEPQDRALLLYKMKSNGYKFSWLLVPLSIPVMWLMFFWRREFRLYDHAVFVTYSISFMTLLLIVVVLAGAAGLNDGARATLTTVVPALHIYKQLRGTYRLSRASAVVRLALVLLAAWIVLGIFVAMLFLMGALD